MSAIVKPLIWFYHEFGVVSINRTGRDAWFIILARTGRMFAYGTNSLILAIFFSALNYSDHQIGLFMTLTLLGDVFLGTYLTLIADRVGRRRVLLGGSVLMILSGVMFALFEQFWVLLGAAILGVISITGGDFGPFRSVEESVLSQLTTPSTRSDVLAWYVTTAALGSSLGSEASGRILSYLQARDGWTPVDAYHALFWIYTAMGFVNVAFVLALSDACELQGDERSYSQIPQDESEHAGRIEQPEDFDSQPPVQIPKSWWARISAWFGSTIGRVSVQTRTTMYKLWLLLAVDALADGMVPWSLTNYYVDIKFHPTKATLGDVTAISYFLAAIGASFAGPLARKIGLVNTMVFTHVPSSMSVLLFPFPPYFWMAAGLVFIRSGLNNMDQAPRAALIAAVVKPEERTAIMGITSMLRTLAAMGGPTLTGALAARQQFWIAFVFAGLCRLAYDFGLYALFVNIKLYEHEPKPVERPNNHFIPHPRTGASDVEMQSLSASDSGVDEEDDQGTQSKTQVVPSGLHLAASHERVRSRSPHAKASREM